MPLARARIQPVHVSVDRIPTSVRQNELNCCANGTFANLIRQLSSLSSLAADSLTDLATLASSIDERANALSRRVSNLKQQLLRESAASRASQPPQEAEHRLSNFHPLPEHRAASDGQTKPAPVPTGVAAEQRLLARGTLPQAMRDAYDACDKAPELHRLSAYREDGRNALELYTNPNYFFDEWARVLVAEQRRRKQERLRRSNSGRATPQPAGETSHRRQRRRRPDAARTATSHRRRASNTDYDPCVELLIDRGGDRTADDDELDSGCASSATTTTSSAAVSPATADVQPKSAVREEKQAPVGDQLRQHRPKKAPPPPPPTSGQAAIPAVVAPQTDSRGVTEEFPPPPSPLFFEQHDGAAVDRDDGLRAAAAAADVGALLAALKSDDGGESSSLSDFDDEWSD